MKVCVLGTGRSGTTAIYYLLQNILEDSCERGVDFVYEPLLWDRETFDRRYDGITDEFQHGSSISQEGIACHLRLPLFVSDPGPYLEDEYLPGLFEPTTQGRAVLLKFIRANGRIRLLRELAGECKFVFVVRNPLDVVNSIAKKFSFFGEEYHPDDYERFSLQAEGLYDHPLLRQENELPVRRHLLFWWCMNRFLLESIPPDSPNTFVVSIERYTRSPASIIRELCEFLEVPCQEKYLETSRVKIGWVTPRIHLGRAVCEAILPYVDEWTDFLEERGVAFPSSLKDDVVRKYAEILGREGPA
jgi:hypothetical protein